MTAFQRIFACEEQAHQTALAAQRARIAAERQQVPRPALDRLIEAEHAAEEIAGSNARQLDRLWHELSRGMFPPPVPQHDEAHAALADCGAEALDAATESLRRITGRTGRRH